MIDGYGRLGLSRNPFVADPAPGVGETLWIDRADLAEVDPPVPGFRRFVQLIGPKGAGKTTTLLRWRASHPGPYRHVGPAWWQRFAPLPVASICFWDEVDRVAAWRLRASLRRAVRHDATVVIGTHRDLAHEAARAGLPVTTVSFEPISPAEARRWSDSRIESVRLREDCWRPGEDEIASALAEAGSSWRTFGDRLHVAVANAARKAAAGRA